MDVHTMKRWLHAAATGSTLLLMADATRGGDLCAEQPSRPHVSAADAPNWGYHQTCWQRFPPLPPCPQGSVCGLTTHFMHTGTPVGFDALQSSSLLPTPDAMPYAGEPLQPSYSTPSFPVTTDTAPVSVMPPAMSTGRYGTGDTMLAPSGMLPPAGPHSPAGVQPSRPAPASPLPPLPAPPAMPAPMPGGAAVPVPSVDPTVRTFQARPPGGGQARRSTSGAMLPNQLVLASDGRVHAVRVQPASSSTSLSGGRYGSVPGQSASPSPVISANAGSRYGLPAASRPVRPASRSLPASLPRNSTTRYGR